MGRPSEGWKLRRKGRFLYVRFTAHGRDVERSTRQEDRDRAADVAARIYAEELRSPRRQRGQVAQGALGIREAAEQWLTDEEPLRDELTNATYALYARSQWSWFGSVDGITDASVRAYRSERLRRVAASTVSKELIGLRAFVRWLGLGIEVPGVPRRAVGSPDPRHWAGAQEISPSECESILALLPSPARERYTVAYETALRPATLDGIRSPEHYRKGAAQLLVPRELDKARDGRPLPLTARARAALDARCSSKPGLIFGPNRHRKLLKAAASKVLSADRAKRFCPTDLRAARITLWLEQSGNLPGTQYLAGHRQSTTTARYVKPSLRAARDVLGNARKPKRKKPG